MPFNFSEKNVLVTGATQGVGKATAIAFAQAGARVAVHYNQQKEKAEQVANALPGEGHIAVQANFMDPASIKQMVDTVLARFGHVDILVNNAVTYRQPHPLDSLDYDSWADIWHEMINTNLVGTANVTYCVARHMITRRTGRIVNVSSRGAFRGEPENPAYGASKAGLNALCQSLAVHLAPHNVYVNAVAPGFIETESVQEKLKNNPDIRRQSPLNRVAKPEEVAYTILFLASDGAEFTTGGIVDLNGASYLRT